MPEGVEMRNGAWWTILAVGLFVVMAVLVKPDSLEGYGQLALREGIIIFTLVVVIPGAFDALKSSLLGIQPELSREEENPAAIGNRIAGLFLGVAIIGIGLVMISLALGVWGPFEPLWPGLDLF